jgi:hypothetical protein
VIDPPTSKQNFRDNLVNNEGPSLDSPNGSITTITMPQILITTDESQVERANNSQFIIIDQPLHDPAQAGFMSLIDIDSKLIQPKYRPEQELSH